MYSGNLNMWQSEYWTSLDFEWLKMVAIGPDFE